MTSLNKLAEKWKEVPAFRAEYDALEEEFALAAALIEARGQPDPTSGTRLKITFEAAKS